MAVTDVDDLPVVRYLETIRGNARSSTAAVCTPLSSKFDIS
jgi:hypothetical protein